MQELCELCFTCFDSLNWFANEFKMQTLCTYIFSFTLKTWVWFNYVKLSLNNDWGGELGWRELCFRFCYHAGWY